MSSVPAGVMVTVRPSKVIWNGLPLGESVAAARLPTSAALGADGQAEPADGVYGGAGDDDGRAVGGLRDSVGEGDGESAT